MFQACDSGWRCDIKCRALAHTRKCAIFPLVSVPCFCDQRERNLTGDVLPSASRPCSVRLQQSAHVFAFSLLSSSTVPVCWSCADSSTHLRWLKTSSWWKKRVAVSQVFLGNGNLCLQFSIIQAILTSFDGSSICLMCCSPSSLV